MAETSPTNPSEPVTKEQKVESLKPEAPKVVAPATPTLTKPVAPAPATKPTPPQTEAPINWELAEAHLVLVENNLLKFAGKPGYNPHFYLVERVEPLKKRYNGYIHPTAGHRVAPERSLDLYNAIMLLDKNHNPVRVHRNVGKDANAATGRPEGTPIPKQPSVLKAPGA